MARFAFIAPPFLGHLNPMAALARALMRRGHEAVFIAQTDAALRLPPDLPFQAVGLTSHPAGDLAATENRMGRLNGPFGLRRMIGDVACRTDMLAREGAPVLRGLRIDAIVADQMEAAGGLLADHLDLPFVSIANALLINPEPDLPPPYTDWRYEVSAQGRRRNRGGYRIGRWLMRPVGDVIEGWSQRWSLQPRRQIEDCLSPLAQITQTVPGFDYPRLRAPAILHSCGPLRDDANGEDQERFADPLGRPLVFASLGTLQGGRGGLFRTIAEACRRLDLALVLAHGGRLSPQEADRLPGSPVVRDFVNQRQVLAGASLAITNGGLNTVLDALSCGTPVATIPLAFEQGAIAARLVRSGAGASIGPLRLTGGRLARLIETVLDDPAFARHAATLGAEIEDAGGVARAAAIVERVALTGRPVTRADMTVAALRA